jgi:hypothetical protein
VTKIPSVTFVNFVAPKAGAKHVLCSTSKPLDLTLEGNTPGKLHSYSHVEAVFIVTSDPSMNEL